MDNLEKRFATGSQFDLKPKSRDIHGTAIVFNEKTLIGGRFYELIIPDAISLKLLKQDIRCLFNHDQNLIIGRTTSGTLKLTKTNSALEYDVTVPNTHTGNDLLENLRLKNITGSSFTFVVDEDGDIWSKLPNGKSLRTITKIKFLYDVSPVTFPAYPTTMVGLRSYLNKGRGITPSEMERKLRLLEIKSKLL
jgi:HK97 family phage prohead protease